MCNTLGLFIFFIVFGVANFPSIKLASVRSDIIFPSFKVPGKFPHEIFVKSPERLLEMLSNSFFCKLLNPIFFPLEQNKYDIHP